MTEFLIRPSINNKSLFKYKSTVNEKGEKVDIPIIEEKPLTLFLNNTTQNYNIFNQEYISRYNYLYLK